MFWADLSIDAPVWDVTVFTKKEWAVREGNSAKLSFGSGWLAARTRSQRLVLELPPKSPDVTHP